MPRLEFITADISIHRSALIALNIEYLSWVFKGIEQLFGVEANAIVGMPASEYVPTVIDKVCGDAPPKGVFYLLKIDGKLAGMGGLRFLGTGVAELKRIYIRPEYRGLKLGEQTLARLLSDARAFGYQSICLDSALFMQAAHRLYEKAGFTDCPPYAGSEVPSEFQARWRFMELAL
jgi:GNAT superfamily N-acetyltransferase